MQTYATANRPDPWIERFRAEALPRLIQEFGPQKILLFGSRVRGAAHEDSDMDVIVISPFFEWVPFLRRMALVLRKVPFPKHVDYLCYTPQEFERLKDDSTILLDVLPDAMEIPI